MKLNENFQQLTPGTNSAPELFIDHKNDRKDVYRGSVAGIVMWPEILCSRMNRSERLAS